MFTFFSFFFFYGMKYFSVSRKSFLVKNNCTRIAICFRCQYYFKPFSRVKIPRSRQFLLSEFYKISLNFSKMIGGNTKKPFEYTRLSTFCCSTRFTACKRNVYDNLKFDIGIFELCVYNINIKMLNAILFCIHT